MLRRALVSVCLLVVLAVAGAMWPARAAQHVFTVPLGPAGKVYGGTETYNEGIERDSYVYVVHQGPLGRETGAQLACVATDPPSGYSDYGVDWAVRSSGGPTDHVDVGQLPASCPPLP